MNLHEHFLPQDLVQASKEYKSFKDCMKHVQGDMKKGDIAIAKHYTIEMIRSIHELSKLADKKSKNNRQRLMYQGMPTVTHIEITRMISDE